MLVAVVALFGWHKARGVIDGPDASEPSCSWAAHIEHASSDQTALIRCYLRAVAHHSTDELQAVVPSGDNGGPTGFTASDFAHAADARSGQATVQVIPNSVDSGDATVSIRYADGAHEVREIYLANPTENAAHSWRFGNVGTHPQDPDAPPAAAW